MLAWTIQISLISILLIFLVHHLIMFFKTTLTVPKIKDLVDSPNQKYQHIFNIISNQEPTFNPINPNSYTSIDLLPSDILSNNMDGPANSSMKNELKSFLKNKLSVNDLSSPVNDLSSTVNDLTSPVNNLSSPVNSLTSTVNNLSSTSIYI